MPQDWKLLTAFIKVAKPAPSFLTKTFEQVNRALSPVPKVTLRNMDATVTAAPLRGLYTQAVNQNETFAYTETDINPPQIFVKIPITEELLLSQISDPSLIIADTGSVTNNVMFVYAEAVARLKRMVLNRIELMCAQIAGTGKINYNDGTYTYTLTYTAPSAVTLDPDSNLLLWLKDLVTEQKKHGFAPAYILVSKDVASVLLDNKYIDKALTKANYAVGTISLKTEPFVTPLFELPDLPPVLIYDVTIGSESPFGTGKVVLLDPNGLGIAYGAVANANLNADMKPVVGDIFAFEAPSVDGSSVDVYAVSRPLPYVLNVNALKIYAVTFEAQP